MIHLIQRLAERHIAMDASTLAAIASKYDCAAVILAKGIHQGISTGDYHSRLESNGDMVVLIVRDHKPITIMFRRSNQPTTAAAMRVNEVVYHV